MSVRRLKRILLLAVLFAPGLASAQDEPGPALYRHEIGFGAGVASPLEQHPLNVPGEQKVPTSFALSFLYRYHINSSFSVGIQMLGYTRNTPTYAVQKEGEPTTRDLSFTLTSLDIGAHVRYTLFEGSLRPYVLAMLNYVTGSLQNDQAGTLNNSGFSAGGGVGVAWAVSPHVGISLEGLGVFGNASWKEKPFLNSTSADYDPSWVGAFVCVSYFWGE